MKLTIIETMTAFPFLGLFMSPFPFCSFSFYCLQRFHPSALSLHLSLTLFKPCFPHGTSVTGHPASLFVGSSHPSCPSAVVSRSEHSLRVSDTLSSDLPLCSASPLSPPLTALFPLAVHMWCYFPQTSDFFPSVFTGIYERVSVAFAK